MTPETVARAADDIDPAIRALLPNYIRRRESDMETIGRLLEQQDYREIGRLAHNMRGSGAAYGYPHVSTLAGQIEQAVENQDIDSMRELIDELGGYVKQMRPD